MCCAENGWTDRAVFSDEKIPSPCPTLCYNGIRICPKITILSSGTVSKFLNLSDFSAFSPRRVDRCCPISSTVAPSHVHHSDRPPLFTTGLPWRKASRGCGTSIWQRGLIVSCKAARDRIWPLSQATTHLGRGAQSNLSGTHIKGLTIYTHRRNVPWSQFGVLFSSTIRFPVSPRL